MATGFRVATWNLHGCRPPSGPRSIRDILTVLESLEADLICLQELWRTPWTGDQFGRLCRGLGLTGWFTGATGPHYGIAILTARPVRRVSTRRVLGPGEPRVVQQAAVVFESQEVALFHTHLGLMERSRRASLRWVAHRLEECRGPALVVGDLNVSPTSRELDRLRQRGLVDAALTAGPTFPSFEPSVRLDQVWVRPQVQVAEARTLSLAGSDHLPLLVDLELGE